MSCSSPSLKHWQQHTAKQQQQQRQQRAACLSDCPPRLLVG
jgi:hypothetical protein